MEAISKGDMEGERESTYFYVIDFNGRVIPEDDDATRSANGILDGPSNVPRAPESFDEKTVHFRDFCLLKDHYGWVMLLNDTFNMGSFFFRAYTPHVPGDNIHEITKDPSLVCEDEGPS